MRTSLKRLCELRRAAEARMPSWALPGPRYLLPLLSGVPTKNECVGWPEVADIDQQPTDRVGSILVRPDPIDLCERFHQDWQELDLEEARRRLTRALVALDERLQEQKIETARTGYSDLAARSDARWGKVAKIEDEIEGHVGSSVLALAATFLIRIELDEGALGTDRATLAAIRPQLVGPIAEDVDRVLAQGEEALS